MYRFLLIILCLCFLPEVWAQKTLTVTVEETYLAPLTQTIEEARREAFKRAQIKAIEENFGRHISQNNSMYTTTAQGNSASEFHSFSSSDVNGEWVETVEGPKYEVEVDMKNKVTVVTCKVKGKIREVTPSRLDFKARILCNGTTEQFERADFKDGDNLYLSFQSPYNGYLMVFFVDQMAGVAYCILPYQMSKEYLHEIKKGREYVFFSEETVSPDQRPIVDEYKMTCTTGREINDIYVIFNDGPFSLPVDMHVDSDGMKSIKLADFEKWKAKIKRENKDIVIKQQDILITRK